MHEKPLLDWTLRALLTAEGNLRDLGVALCEFFIVARPEEWGTLETLVAPLREENQRVRFVLIEGGATRQESVGNAARMAKADYLLVHDAARPLLSRELVVRVMETALRSGAAIAAVPAADTVKIARQDEGFSFVQSTLERENIWLAQTPQVFRRKLYLDALETASRAHFAGTDCASLLERARQPVSLVEGESENFKITYGEDLARAEAILSAREIAVN